MNIKKTLLAAALAAFAFAALPALASAEVTGMHVKFGAGDKTGFTIHQDGEIEPVLETAELKVQCTSFSGEGEFENTTTGWIQITFHGCKSFGLFNCTTAGAESAGTIETTILPFHVEPVNENPGILITPEDKEGEKIFTTFACFGVTTKVEGNGVIGTITSPDWTTPTTDATVVFSQTEGTQDHLTTDTSSTEYDLIANRGGSKETAAQSGAGTITFEEDVELEDTGEVTP